jgi:hypothetical protein
MKHGILISSLFTGPHTITIAFSVHKLIAMGLHQNTAKFVQHKFEICNHGDQLLS